MQSNKSDQVVVEAGIQSGSSDSDTDNGNDKPELGSMSAELINEDQI